MRFLYGFCEGIDTVNFFNILKSMGITVLKTPMVSVNMFMVITDCGTIEQIEEAKAKAKRL